MSAGHVGARRRLAGVVIAACVGLAAGGCHKAPTVAQAAPAPAHDPGDYSSLRQFPLKDLTQSSVTVAGQQIPVWVMDTEAKRAEGYMFLRPQDAPDGHGMIFIFPTVQPGDVSHGFWMRDCLLELDIAFISPDRKVLNVQRGKKLNDTSLPPSGPYKYVLELKAGEAAKFGVKPGVKIDIPTYLKGKA